jgi:hypothetical protein
MKKVTSRQRAKQFASILCRIAQTDTPPGRELDRLFEMGDGAFVTAHFIDLYDTDEALRAVCSHPLASRYINLPEARATAERLQGIQLELLQLPKPKASPAPQLPSPHQHTLKINPAYNIASGRTGSLSGVTPDEVHQRLPEAHFDGRTTDDKKVTMEWQFVADGHPCAIWDYRGAQFSTFGPDHVFKTLFGNTYSVR